MPKLMTSYPPQSGRSGTKLFWNFKGKKKKKRVDSVAGYIIFIIGGTIMNKKERAINADKRDYLE